jgi:hypothetical protein
MLNIKWVILIIFFFSLGFNVSSKENAEIRIKSEGSYIQFLFINKGTSPLKVYENFIFNPCEYKNGMCIRDALTGKDINIRHGGNLEKVKIVYPYEIAGRVVKKEYSPFDPQAGFFGSSAKIYFIYFGPEDQVYKSNDCSLTTGSEGFDFDCSFVE